MKQLKVDSLISWDKEESRLLSTYPAILVEVKWLPGSGNGYLEACHPSTNRRNIRWYADGSVVGMINGNTLQQVVASGSILRLVPDGVNPRLEEWVVAISPLEVGLEYIRPRARRKRRRSRRS